MHVPLEGEFIEGGCQAYPQNQLPSPGVHRLPPLAKLQPPALLAATTAAVLRPCTPLLAPISTLLLPGLLLVLGSPLLGGSAGLPWLHGRVLPLHGRALLLGGGLSGLVTCCWVPQVLWRAWGLGGDLLPCHCEELSRPRGSEGEMSSSGEGTQLWKRAFYGNR